MRSNPTQAARTHERARRVHARARPRAAGATKKRKLVIHDSRATASCLARRQAVRRCSGRRSRGGARHASSRDRATRGIASLHGAKGERHGCRQGHAIHGRCGSKRWSATGERAEASLGARHGRFKAQSSPERRGLWGESWNLLQPTTAIAPSGSSTRQRLQRRWGGVPRRSRLHDARPARCYAGRGSRLSRASHAAARRTPRCCAS